MSPSNNHNIQPPAHGRPSRSTRNRRASLRAPEPPRPAHGDHDTPAFFQDYASSSRPAPQPSQGPNTSALPTTTSNAPSNAPREPQPMRQTNPFRGGRKKTRAYAELQIKDLPTPSQDKYQQAISYIDEVVRKETDIKARQCISELSQTQRPSKMPALSPILQALQSNREGGYFSLKPGLRGAEPQKKIPVHKTAQVKESEWATKRRSPNEESVSNSSNEQELLEAMEGLKLFGNLRSAADEPPASSLDVMEEKKLEDVESLSSTRIDAEDAPPARSRSVSQDTLVQQISSCERKSSRILVDYDEAAKDAAIREEKVGHEHSKFHEVGRFPVGQDIFQAAEKLPVPSAQPASPENARVELTNTQGDVLGDSFVKSTSNFQSDVERSSREDMFEDIPLDSPIPGGPTPSSPTSSLQYASSDDDFEHVDTSKYQTNRNGRAGIWDMWAQRRP